MPCPNGIAIPSIFEIYNDGVAYNIPNRGTLRYQDSLLEGKRADLCVRCNKCIEVCPQKIDIPEWLGKIHKLLGASAVGQQTKTPSKQN
jgi:predicted aldo/keto reductase-like oxidoreductase